MKRKSMRVLGIETSSSVCAVASLVSPPVRGRAFTPRELLARARIKEREHGGDGARHSEAIYGLLDGVLPGGRAGLKALDLIAVSIGPGSFTGLRVGLAVAKTFAKFGAMPLIGVPTLKAAAFQAAVADGAAFYVPTLDARRGELYVQVFRSVRGDLKAVRGPWVSAPEDLPARLPAGARLLEAARPRAATIAALGLARFMKGAEDDPDSLVPLYVRRPEAVEKLRRGLLGKPRPRR